MPFDIFVDESGSAGPNLKEAAQPVFVNAGLLVPVARKDAVRALAAQLRCKRCTNPVSTQLT